MIRFGVKDFEGIDFEWRERRAGLQTCFMVEMPWWRRASAPQITAQIPTL
jgi:hypothetical protein